jgi:ATP-dependent protease ClpP protease subunit
MPETISLRGPIGFEARAADLRAALDKIGNKPVRIEINSPGGFVFEGLDMFNLIRDHKGRTEVVLMGLAASMASYVALAADKVLAHDNAVYMIHNALALSIGNHNDMRKVADRLEGISNLIAQQYMAKTGKSLEEIKELMDSETYLFGKEMLDAGFVDEIIEAPKDKDPRRNKDKGNALTEARTMIESCRDMMRGSEAANQDFEKAVAFMDLQIPSAGTGKQEDADDIDLLDMVGESFDPEMPFPNEHACRVRVPGDFQQRSFRRITRKADGKDLDIIIGRLKGKTTTTTQAFRYPKDQWTTAEARRHCARNKGILFEPATAYDTPAGAGKKEQEGRIMPTLKELLADNPSAKVEYDAAIAGAKILGREEGEKAFQELVAKATPVFKSAYYPTPLKDLAEKALKGEVSADAMLAAVASFDSTKEGQELRLAAEEQSKQKETPAQPQSTGGQEDGTIASEEDFQSEMAEIKGKGDE